MNLKTISLATLAVTATFVVVFPLRESYEPDRGGVESSSNAKTETIEAAAGYRASTNALTKQEQDQLAELRGTFSEEELERLFNPPTITELKQTGRENLNEYFDPFAFASRRYDRDWSAFVDGLDLSEVDTRLVRDAWIEFEARESDLINAAFSEGFNEPGEFIPVLDGVESQLYSRLSSILSPEQMTAFQAHRTQIHLDSFARADADHQEMIEDGFTGIVVAASDNDLPTVQAYLASGADPNRLTADGQSAVHKAARGGSTEVLRALINAGADVNLTILEGHSALYFGASRGHTDAVNLLIEAGADTNYYGNGNPVATALHAAAMNGNTETVRVLLEAGADATGAAGKWALVSAIGLGDQEMERILIEAGAPADALRVAERRSFFDLGRKLGLVKD